LSLPDPDILAPTAPSGRWRVLFLLAAAELLGMSLWFSASASVPAIQAEWRFSDSSCGLADARRPVRVRLGNADVRSLEPARRRQHAAALRGIGPARGAFNAAFGLFAKGPALRIPLRFATGFFLAGVYPPGMKIMATWFRRGRGLALGVLVGALTLGKASPYLVNALGGSGWRGHVLFVSLLAVFGGALVLLRGGRPLPTGNAPFNIRQAGEVFRNRGVRLTNFGYFGHMWELYAMWTWAPVFIRASFSTSSSSPVLAEAARSWSSERARWDASPPDFSPTESGGRSWPRPLWRFPGPAASSSGSSSARRRRFSWR
jgi:hypothetical protein